MLNANRLFKYPLPPVHLWWYWTSWCLFISSGSWQPSVSSVHLVGYCICCQYAISIYACPYIHSLGVLWSIYYAISMGLEIMEFLCKPIPHYLSIAVLMLIGLAILTAALLSGLILFFLGPTQSFSLPPSSYLWLIPPPKLSIAILLLPLIADLQWTRSVPMELGISLSSPQVIFYGNVGATYLSSNPVFHSRMKHIATDFHFVRDLVKLSLRLSQVFSAE